MSSDAKISGASTRRFQLELQPAATMEYALADTSLFRLYEKAKENQWDARTVIDWATPLEQRNPLGLPDTSLPVGRTRWFEQLTRERQDEVRFHYQCWLVSQFLHGEQFGVLSASRIALEAPDHDSKFFAAIQAVDEARHLETYIRLTHKMGLRYGVSSPFEQFLERVISAPEVDEVYLGLQVIGEGIGLASFSQIRKFSSCHPIRAIYARIMEDEARHVAFGRVFLGDLYRNMERPLLEKREAFVVDACSLLAERFCAFEVWEKFGFERDDARIGLQQSAPFRIYRRELFKQIVPVVRDIGLWSTTIENFFGAMGVLRYADSLAVADIAGAPQ